MQIEPHVTAFAKRYARGEAQVVWTTLVSDLETPVSAFLKIAGARPLSFLLESVEGGALRGRYSIIGLNPDLVWRTVAGRAEINRRAQQSADSFTPFGGPNRVGWARSPGTTSRPGTFFRSCCHNVARRRSNCRHLRSTGHYGGSTRRLFCISSTSEVSRSPARARRSSCVCAKAP